MHRIKSGTFSLSVPSVIEASELTESYESLCTEFHLSRAIRNHISSTTTFAIDFAKFTFIQFNADFVWRKSSRFLKNNVIEKNRNRNMNTFEFFMHFDFHLRNKEIEEKSMKLSIIV